MFFYSKRQDGLDRLVGGAKRRGERIPGSEWKEEVSEEVSQASSGFLSPHRWKEGITVLTTLFKRCS